MDKTTVYIQDKYLYPFNNDLYDFEDKTISLNNYIRYTLDRTLEMFEYRGLPETIKESDLELFLQVNTHCIVTEVQGNLYALKGGFAGEPDAYYHPTQYTVANPYLNLSKTYTINKDCILCRNDALFIGLMPLIRRYGTLMVENDLSMKLATINTRIQRFITAGDSIQKQACEKFLKDVVGGKIGVVLMNEFLEGVKTADYNNTSNSTHQLTQLIELQQYLKAGLFNELGLNANYNMKRESINEHEAQLNNDSLLPFVEQMLRQRKTFTENINKMYGTNIEVDFASSWKMRDEFNKLALEEAETGVTDKQINPDNPTGKEEPQQEPENSKDSDVNDMEVTRNEETEND